MSFELANHLLHQFGELIELQDLQLDPEGYCCLQFDEVRVHLQFEAEQDRLVIFSNVGTLDYDVKQEACELLLAANLFWSGTNGATLSLQSEDNIVFLLDKRAIQGLEYTQFEKWLGDFVNSTEVWSQKIDELNDGGGLALDGNSSSESSDSDNIVFA